MKLFSLSILALLCLLVLPSRAQNYGSRYNPIAAGYYVSSSPSDFYDNNENNSTYNGFGNNIGNQSDDVWYTFTVGSTTTVNISTCGSDFDTYLHILDQNGNELASNDDNGPLCVGNQASIRITLSPGTYYVAVEGYAENCGNIAFMINNADLNYSIQAALITSIDAGSFGACGSRTFMDYNNNSFAQNKYGQGSGDIFYRFTVTETSLINISLCGSNFDTYLHLLNESGVEIESNDDNGPLCSGSQSSIQTTLSPGTYYAVAEGFSFNSGDIVLEISYTGNGTLIPGTSLSTAIDAGTLSTFFRDTRDNSPSGCYQNLMGEQSNEIYYKFTLPASSEVSLSHYGTSFDTYMHLLDNNGTQIAANDGNGPLCAGSQASIKITLGPGTYYVVSEGKGTASGNITTSLSSVLPVVYSTQAIDPETRSIDINLPVGSTEGQTSVTLTGAATYSIPFFTPPGISGMTPNVSLVYSSQSGNGIAGYGWNISGLGAISRIPHTIYHDGDVKGVSFVDDRFALDGQGINNVSGNYGGDLTTYNTDVFEGSKIVSHGNLGGAPEWFEVLKKDGSVVEYGRTDDSRFKSQLTNQATVLWNINKITDANGNYIQFVYNRGDIECYISEIKYTGNYSDANNLAEPSNSIKFYYSNRTDKSTNFIAGSRVEHNVLLDHIDIISEDQRIKSYKLKYIFNIYSKLNELEEYGKDNKKYNSTVIQWGEDNPNIEVSTLPVPTAFCPWCIDGNNVRSWFSSDLNGDGLTDLACLNKETNYDGDLKLDSYICSLDNSGKPVFTLNTDQYILDFAGMKSGSLFSEPSLVFRTPLMSFADFTGDGNKVAIYPTWLGGSTNAFLFRIAGKTDVITGTSQIGTEMPAFSVADINNDGIDEIITVEKGISNNTVIVKICYSNYTWKTISLNISSQPKDILVQDFNGDGLKDILIATDNGICLYKNNGGGISTDNYTTVSFTLQSVLNTFNASYSTVKLGDFNGDGLMDFILNEHCNSNWKLAINNGNWGFDVSPLTNFTAVEEEFTTGNDDKEDCIVTDFNNDGKSDVILIDAVYEDPSHWYENSYGRFVKTNVTWYASTGTGFNVAKTFTTTDENYTFNRFNTIGDFDGDGREELLTYGSDLYNGNAKADMMYIHRSSGTNFEANLVKSITDGLDKKTDISYQPLTHTTTTDNKPFYSKGTGSVYPVIDIQMPLYCVSKLSEPNGLGGVNTTEYAYSEARAHLTGGGFLGFKSQTSSNAVTNRKVVSTTDMNLTYCMPDKQTTEVSTASGTAVSKTESYYSNTKTGNIYQSLPLQTVEHDYLNDLSKTTDYVGFDAYGNLTTLRTTQGDLITTQNSTYVQKGGWYPNKPESVSVTREQGTGAYTRSMSYTYDDKGNLTKEITDPGDANQKTVEYKSRNIYGQPTITEMTANGILRSASISYTPSGRFIQTKTDVLGQSTTYNWDETRGLLNTEVNRLGTTTYTYNGMGQLTGTQYPDGTYKSQTAQWASSGNAFGALYYVQQEASGVAPTYTWYDGLQRPLVQETYGLNGNQSRVFTQYRTDGKTDKVSAPTFDPQAGVWDATYSYYDDGRVQTVTTPLGASTTTYNGKTTTVCSPEGTQTTVLNSAGQLQSSTVNSKTVTYNYYASGKQKSATPEGGQPVAMEYDLQGNRTKLTDPASGVSTALYNGYGELKWEKQTNTTSQGEITTDYTYDDNTGQLLARVRNGETTSYGYDALKRLSTVEISGQHKQTYTYGDYDRISALTELIGTRSFEKQLAYDSYGRVTTTTYPSGYYTLNNYDAYGNLNEITDQSSRSIWKATQANARGNITTEMKGSKTTVYGYDDAKAQLTSITASGVVDYSFGYDTKNNLSYRGDNLINQKELFTYDTQNRLTNWDIHNATSNTLLKTNSMSYDNLGNIVTRSDLDIPNAVTLKYENTANPYMLTSISGKPDVIPNDNLDVTYTDFRKIKTLTEGTKQYSITYGVDDQRRRSDYAINGITKTRYYLGDYEEESDNNGNVKKIHYLSGGAVLVQDNGVETLYYGYKNNQGSLIALTDQNGTVVEKYAYDPWGARRNPADWTLKDTRSSFITNRGYTGHEHLDPFNIINMNGRVYDPVTAQFFSPDPFIQSPGDWMNYNGYSYVMNNPTRATDPTGYVVTPQETGPFTHLDGGQVERGEKDWDPYGFHANNYYGDGYGNYFNWNGDDVSREEVYNNYILPNSRQLSVTNTFSFGSDRNYMQNSLNSDSKLTGIDGFHFSNHQTWYIRDGLEELNKILDGISGRNNSPFIGGDRDWLNKTQIGMGAYGVSHNAQGELINYAAKFDASVNDLKYVKSFKIAGKALIGAGAAITSYQVIKDIQNGKYYSAGARTAVYGVAAGAAFIPVVGWGVAAGIGLADAIWGEQFYNWVGIKMGE